MPAHTTKPLFRSSIIKVPTLRLWKLNPINIIVDTVHASNLHPKVRSARQNPIVHDVIRPVIGGENRCMKFLDGVAPGVALSPRPLSQTHAC